MSAMTTTSPRRFRTTNLLLACNAALLGVIAVGLLGKSGLATEAIAQDSGKVSSVGGSQKEDDSPTAYISAGEQRKAMIAELRTIASRLERVESAISRGISVKITSMPAGRDNREDRDTK